MKHPWIVNIHPSYNEFINDNVNLLFDIYDKVKNDEYTPDAANVLKFMNNDLNNIKIIIMGQDPYFSIIDGKKVATGRAYEPNNLKYFTDIYRQVSLKNIIRLIHKNYNHINKYEDILSYKEIQKEILYGRFDISTPKKWFDSLEKQGVLLINSSLTTIVNKPLSHEKLWKEFIRKLLLYLGKNNPNIIYFLWGNSANSLKEYISGKIYSSRHPMMCSIKYEDDFLKNDCFKETMNIIDWLGH